MFFKALINLFALVIQKPKETARDLSVSVKLCGIKIVRQHCFDRNAVVADIGFKNNAAGCAGIFNL